MRVSEGVWFTSELFSSAASFRFNSLISSSFNVTTVGISYDDKSGIIQNVLVGGPAFNSKQVHHGDKIVSIDGAAVQPGDILALLKVLFV